jgi:hypothetical protein
MAKTKIEVDLVVKGGDSVGQVEGKVVSLKQQLKNLKAELASGNLTGKAFDDAARKAGELQDRIGDVSQRVKNLASDSQKLDGFVNIAQGIVGGFAAVQGITALVGDENEELQKTMVKLQASMTALNGIQAVANMLNKDSAAMTSLNTIKTGAQSLANQFLTATTLQSAAATNVLRGVLIASGIGAIVLLIIAAANAMDAFGDATENTTEKLKEQQDRLDAYNAKVETLNNYSLANLKRQSDIDKARLKLQGETNDKLLEEDLKFLRRKLDFDLQAFQATKAETEARAKAQDQYSQTESEIALKKLEIQQAKKDEKQKRLDAQTKKVKVDNSQKEFDETFAQLEKEMTLEFEANERFNERELKANQDRLDAEKAADDKAKADKKLADEKATQAYIDNIMARQSIAQSSFDIINSLGELAIGQQYKQTALGKTLALAQIATDTAVAISSAGVAAAKATAATGNPLSGVAVYVTTVAGILANVLRAKSILSGGGASGGSGGSGGGGGQQNSNPPPITGFTRGVDAQGNQITKVVVLEKDITNSQARVVRIRTNAELI